MLICSFDGALKLRQKPFEKAATFPEYRVWKGFFSPIFLFSVHDKEIRFLGECLAILFKYSI